MRDAELYIFGQAIVIDGSINNVVFSFVKPWIYNNQVTGKQLCRDCLYEILMSKYICICYKMLKRFLLGLKYFEGKFPALTMFSIYFIDSLKGWVANGRIFISYF